MIGQRYKRANSVSRDLLLKTLHLEKPRTVSKDIHTDSHHADMFQPSIRKHFQNLIWHWMLQKLAQCAQLSVCAASFKLRDCWYMQKRSLCHTVVDKRTGRAWCFYGSKPCQKQQSTCTICKYVVFSSSVFLTATPSATRTHTHAQKLQMAPDLLSAQMCHYNGAGKLLKQVDPAFMSLLKAYTLFYTQG